MKTCTEYDANIQLYVDGELTGEERVEFLSHLENCPPCCQALREAESFSQQIRAARLAVTASASLRAAVLRQIQQAEAARNRPSLVPRRTPDRCLWSLTAAVGVLILVAGGLLVNRERQANQAGIMIQAAVLAHQELEQHVLPLDISSASSQEVSSWFQSRVPFPFRMANSGIASDLTAKYKLTGGRLLTVNSGPVALVAFSLPHDLVTMLVCPEHLMQASGGTVIKSGGVILHNYDQGSLHIVTWNERGLGYVLTFTAQPMSNPRHCASCHSENPAEDTVRRGATSRSVGISQYDSTNTRVL
jgi:anti-sigma factor RsiW